jgi:signal transduction histidine kinase
LPIRMVPRPVTVRRRVRYVERTGRVAAEVAMAQIGVVATDGRLRRRPMLFGVGRVDLAAGVLLSAAVVVLVHVDLYASDPHGDLIEALAAVSMTLPVVWARRYPLPAAGVVALGAVVNWLIVGHFVRCGAAIPAAFWLACAIGLGLRGRRAAAAMALVLIDLQAMCLADAALIPAAIIALAPAAIAFWFAGRTIRSRSEAVERLAKQKAELADTRESTARLAVDNDRRRIGKGLYQNLQRRIDGLAATASLGSERPDNPSAAMAAFSAIASGGRETLAQMRDVVDALRSEGPRQPLPDLSRLADLVSHRGGVLTIDGEPRPLARAIELTGYRVVEQLLRTFPSVAPTVEVSSTSDPIRWRFALRGGKSRR